MFLTLFIIAVSAANAEQYFLRACKDFYVDPEYPVVDVAMIQDRTDVGYQLEFSMHEDSLYNHKPGYASLELLLPDGQFEVVHRAPYRCFQPKTDKCAASIALKASVSQKLEIREMKHARVYWLDQRLERIACRKYDFKPIKAL